MYSKADIFYAFTSDSKDYPRQCYQKLVERSLDNAENNSSNDTGRVSLDGARSEVWEPME